MRKDVPRSHAPRGNAVAGRSASSTRSGGFSSGLCQMLPRSGEKARDDAERRHEGNERRHEGKMWRSLILTLSLVLVGAFAPRVGR